MATSHGDLAGVFNMSHSPFCYMPPERWNDVRASRSLRADVPFDDVETNRAKAARVAGAFATLKAPAGRRPARRHRDLRRRSARVLRLPQLPGLRDLRGREVPGRARRRRHRARVPGPSGAGRRRCSPASCAAASTRRSRSTCRSPSAASGMRSCGRPSRSPTSRPDRAGVPQLLLRAAADGHALLPARRRRARDHRRASGRPARGRRRLRRALAHAAREGRVPRRGLRPAILRYHDGGDARGMARYFDDYEVPPGDASQVIGAAGPRRDRPARRRRPARRHARDLQLDRRRRRGRGSAGHPRRLRPALLLADRRRLRLLEWGPR